MNQLKIASGLLQSGRSREALDLLIKLNRQNPDNVDVLRMAGISLSRIGQNKQAEALLRRRLELDPESAAARNDLANVLLSSDKPDEALSLLEDFPEGVADTARRFNLGRAYKVLGRAEDAAVPLQQVLDQQPEHFGALIALGDTFKALGCLEDAGKLMRRAIAANPASSTAWWSLSNLKSSPYTEAEFVQLEKLTLSGSVPAQQVYFEFAFARALEDRSRYEEAFEHYREGNQLRQKLEPWNATEFSQWSRQIEAGFDDVQHPARRRKPGSPRPIFIVSLPRSGSTLTEQILAAHSQVTAASELPWLPKLIAEESRDRNSGIAGWASEVRTEDWARLGQNYLDYSRYWYRTTPVFTDKLPGNFPYTGAILNMFPDALVVDVSRQGMDVCWSCYRQLFVQGSGFAYDLQDLAAYWKEHERTMSYWQEREPGRVFRLQYESLVTDPEPQIRKLLEFLDLPFEESCLRFYEAERAVNTASAAQVRQKINTRGIEHWRRYEKQLAGLKNALEPSNWA